MMLLRAKFLAVLLLPGFAISCQNDQLVVTKDTLAVIGKRTIEKDEFVKRYKDFRRRTGEGVPDTYHARREILQMLVDEEVLITQTKKSGLGDDRAARQERQRIEMQELLNAFNREMIARKVEVNDEELRRLFVRLNTKVKARHLYASTREQAEYLYTSLQQGVSFEGLAREVFRDERLQESGGLLGYFTVDEMEPDFENAAFELEIGEISKPVKTSDGYSIIRVDERITKPIITEHEFAKHKHKLYTYWRNRKVKDAIRAFADSLAQTLEVSFNETVLQRIYGAFSKRDSVRTNDQHQNALASLPGLDREELLCSRLGVWTVDDFRQKARFTDETQKAWIISEAKLKEFISGLVVREQVLQLAEKAGLAKQAEYQSKVVEKWDTYLLTRMERTLREEMEVPEDSVLSYFEANRDLFVKPAAVDLREIVLDSEGAANVVQRRLAEGVAFSELAQKYSVRKWSAERGGELGYVTKQDLGRWADTVFAMGIGEQRGPLLMDSKYVFIACIDKRPARTRSFNEAKADAAEAVRFAMFDDYRKTRINDFRRSVGNLSVTPEILKTIKLN